MSQVVSFSDYTPPARFDAIQWESVKIEEATDDSGPWTLIDTITLTPLDTDPSEPQARNITTSNASDASGLWYRLTFVDGDGGTSLPSAPIQNADARTAFATANELETRLGLTFDSDQVERATALLATIADLIRDEVKQEISLVEDDVLTLRGTNADRITLPELPVVSVASVVLGGSDLAEGTDWFLDGNQIVRLAATFVQGLSVNLDEPYLLGTGMGFGRPSQTLMVTYTHGYDNNDLPSVVKTVSLESAVRVFVNPGSVARESSGDTATVYDNMRFSPSGLLLTLDEKASLRRKFGRRAHSITIGG